MNLTQEQIEKYNELYTQACMLIAEEINLDGRELRAPSWFTRVRLEKAKKLFQRTLTVRPTGWNSMFAIGKIEQRLGRQKEALDWLLKAREFEPRNTSLAKEASVTASRLGLHDMAAGIVDEALEHNPNDPALKVNSGLAHILAGHREIALERFGEAFKLEPNNGMNKKLQEYATKVLAGAIPLPKTESDISRFVQ